MAIKPTQEQELIVLEATRGSNLAISAFAGAAKCLGKGTLITMFDGSFLPVEQIKVGDKVLGVDGKARNVLSVSSGTEEMFQINQTKGITFTCNRSHILSVKMSINKNTRYRYGDSFISKGDVVNLSVDEYLQQSSSFKKDSKCYTPESMEFSGSVPVLEPYFVGLWLGDGSSDRCAITKPDLEIKRYLEDFAARQKLSFKVYEYYGKCPIYSLGNSGDKGSENKGNSLLRSLGILNNKHIPSNINSPLNKIDCS